MSDICPDCERPKDSGKGWHLCADDGGKGVKIENLEAEVETLTRQLEEARAEREELAKMLGEGPYVPLHQHEEQRKQLDAALAQVGVLREVLNKILVTDGYDQAFDIALGALAAGVIE